MFWLRRRKAEPLVATPKVWVALFGMPFYIPVTDPLVELHYGREGAERLRKQLLANQQ